MTDFSTSLEPNFEAALSKDDLDAGETNHEKIEQLRKISMLAGLTHSSEELELLCNTDPEAFRDALQFGIQSIDHYKYLLELLENTILRIYSVAANHPAWQDKEIEEFELKISNLLSKNSSKKQH